MLSLLQFNSLTVTKSVSKFSVKAKFHYVIQLASWFEAGSKLVAARQVRRWFEVGRRQVRSWFEPVCDQDSVMEFDFEPVCDQLRAGSSYLDM